MSVFLKVCGLVDRVFEMAVIESLLLHNKACVNYFQLRGLVTCDALNFSRWQVVCILLLCGQFGEIETRLCFQQEREIRMHYWRRLS